MKVAEKENEFFSKEKALKFLENENEEEIEEEISPELKKLLDERIKAYEQNPENVSTWEEVKERLNKKYGYEI